MTPLPVGAGARHARRGTPMSLSEADYYTEGWQRKRGKRRALQFSGAKENGAAAPRRCDGRAQRRGFASSPIRVENRPTPTKQRLQQGAFFSSHRYRLRTNLGNILADIHETRRDTARGMAHPAIALSLSNPAGRQREARPVGPRSAARLEAWPRARGGSWPRVRWDCNYERSATASSTRCRHRPDGARAARRCHPAIYRLRRPQEGFGPITSGDPEPAESSCAGFGCKRYACIVAVVGVRESPLRMVFHASAINVSSRLLPSAINGTRDVSVVLVRRRPRTKERMMDFR